MQHENSFIQRVLTYSDHHGLLSQGQTVVVAVSGGVDSVVLLDVLTHLAPSLDLTLHVAHLNHRLRPNSGEDRDFVETLARDLRLTCHTQEADIASRARSNGESLEEAGREMRRSFLSGVSSDVGAHRIALGHHLDDQAETVLMRLTRGAGLTGLAGIRPLTAGGWIRPLLAESRAAIDAYVNARGLHHVDDVSNNDTRFLRNRIRHRVIPRLRTEFSDAIPAVIARTADLLRSDEDFLAQTAVDAFKTVTCVQTDRKIALDGPACFRYHIAIQRRLFRLAAGRLGVDLRELSAARVNDALDRFSRGSSRVDLTPDLTACFDGRLFVFGRRVGPFDLPIKESGLTQYPQIGAELVVSCSQDRPRDLKTGDPFTAWFDPSRLGSLRLRSVQPGDRIEPYGLSGRVKISKLLIDRKIPRIVRDEVPVVVSGDEPLWVVGLRTSARALVPEEARRAVHLEFRGDWRNLANALQLPSSKAPSDG